MLIVKFEDKNYTISDLTENFYVCGPSSWTEGYHFISKYQATVIADTEEFYNRFEDCWDYTYNMFAGGALYTEFLEHGPDHNRYLLDDIRPKHLSELPEGVQQEFKRYMIKWMADNDMFDPAHLEFTDETAAIDYYEYMHREDEHAET